MRLHCKVREGEETVQNVDVISLYPYVSKYFKFPVGHPVINVGDACQDTEELIKFFRPTTLEILLSGVTVSLQRQAVVLPE